MSKVTELAEQIHTALAQELLGRIKNGTATSSDLNVARQFLKDNGIDSLLIEGAPVHELAKVLPFKDPDARITGTS